MKTKAINLLGVVIETKQQKCIEFNKCLCKDLTVNVNVRCKPSSYHFVALLVSNFTDKGEDLMVAWDGTVDYNSTDTFNSRVYIGHWNDGVLPAN